MFILCRGRFTSKLTPIHLLQHNIQYWAHFPLYCLHSKPVTPNIVRPSILKIDAEHN